MSATTERRARRKGRMQFIGYNLPAEMIEHIRKMARLYGMSQSSYLRGLVADDMEKK